MATEYAPVSHYHQAFVERALQRKGFGASYEKLEDEYRLVRELLTARLEAGLTQEAVAASMGTTKSAVSRLESVGTPSPSVSTLERYARAVGREVEIRLVPSPDPRTPDTTATPRPRGPGRPPNEDG